MMRSENYFRKNIRVILVETKFAENIGSIARICHNFGIEELYLVNPQQNPIDDSALSVAVSGASLLKSAKIVSTLQEAIGGCQVVLGTSDHGIGELQSIDLSAVNGELFLDDAKTGILFGREDIGLKREEIQWCHRILTVSTPHSDNVLNIAHAVVLALWQISSLLNDNRILKMMPDSKVDINELKQILSRFESVLVEMGKSRIEVRKKIKLMQKSFRNRIDIQSVSIIRELLSLLEYQQNKIHEDS